MPASNQSIDRVVKFSRVDPVICGFPVSLCAHTDGADVVGFDQISVGDTRELGGQILDKEPGFGRTVEL